MKKHLPLGALALMTAGYAGHAAAASYSLFISLQIRSATSEIEISKIALAQGESAPNLETPTNAHTLRLLSAENAELYRMQFRIPRALAGSPPRPEWFDRAGTQIYFPKPGEYEAPATAEYITHNITIPYRAAAATISVLDQDGNEVASSAVPTAGELAAEFVATEKSDVEDYITAESARATQGSPLGSAIIALMVIIIGILLAYRKYQEKTSTQSL